MTQPNNLPPSEIPSLTPPRDRFGNDIDPTLGNTGPYLTPNVSRSLSKAEHTLAKSDMNKSHALDSLEITQNVEERKLSEDDVVRVMVERGYHV